MNEAPLVPIEAVYIMVKSVFIWAVVVMVIEFCSRVLRVFNDYDKQRKG